MLAAIWDVAMAVSEGENNWLKLILPVPAVVQSGMPLTAVIVDPVQKMIDSGIIPLSTICVAVLAVTVPLSIGLPVVSVEANVEMRVKKLVFVADGFTTPSSRRVTTPPPYEAATRLA